MAAPPAPETAVAPAAVPEAVPAPEPQREGEAPSSAPEAPAVDKVPAPEAPVEAVTPPEAAPSPMEVNAPPPEVQDASRRAVAQGEPRGAVSAPVPEGGVAQEPPRQERRDERRGERREGREGRRENRGREGRRPEPPRQERREERREEPRREPQEMGPQTRGLTLLGAKTTVYSDRYTPAVLEAFENRHPENDYFVKFNCPEFTSLCPITGQPDFATIYISYIPDRKMVESKSLKLYLFGFRNHGAFHEDCVNTIMKDLIKLMAPRYIEVWGRFLPRGGLSIDPYANYGRPTTRWEEFARQRLLMHDLTPERVDNR